MKLKSALPWAVTILLLCVFLMLPLLFLDGGEIAIIGSVPAEDRNVTLFARYDAGELERTELSESEIKSGKLDAARETAGKISSALFMDSGALRSESSAGEEIYTVADGERGIRVYEYFRGWTADWTNWYNVKTDIDTGDVYYLYCSSICERGYNEYQGRAESFIRSGLESLVAELGFENVDYRQNGAETMHVELTKGGLVYVYDLRCHIYEDAGPSLLVDLSLTLSEVKYA